MVSGFNHLLAMAELIVRILSLLAIVSLQIWWVGAAIVAVAAPLFILSMKAGTENYDVAREAGKYERIAAVLKNFVKMKVSSLITVVISLFIIGVLLYPLVMGSITLGMFIDLASSLLSLIQLMSWQLEWLTEQVTHAGEYLKHLSDFLALPKEDNNVLEKSDVSIVVENIEFKDVTFKYPGTERLILIDFSLKLERGKHYAIVGVNGAGKTTITKLLTGLYDDYQGEILVNGKNLKYYNKRVLMDMFSFVHQDYARYEISLKDNITLGKTGGENNKSLKVSVKLSGLDAAAGTLPKGLDTYLGKIEPDGADVSAGQWQRIAIARALYNPASVRILDGWRI